MVAGAFGNTGTVIDGDGGDAGSSVTVGGTLTNGGALYLQNGATLTATTGLTNSDYLEVDASGSGGSSLTVGGTLTNKNGYFSVGNSGITSATTVRAAGLAIREDFISTAARRRRRCSSPGLSTTTSPARSRSTTTTAPAAATWRWPGR